MTVRFPTIFIPAFLLVVGYFPEVRSQAIDWSDTELFVSAGWIFPQKEFGTYWKDGPAAGIHAEVPFVRSLSLAAMAVLSRHEVAETPRKPEIPALFLFQTGGGVTVHWSLWNSSDAAVSVMLVNNMFILTGPAVRPGLENALESEFGFSFSLSWSVRTTPLPPIRILATYQPILVGLEPVAIVSAGVAVGL